MSYRDVTTGRTTKSSAGAGKHWKAHKGKKNWWVVGAWECREPHTFDQHTHEVCLHNIGPNHSSPTWPILALWSEAACKAWAKKLQAFAKTLEAANYHDHFDKEINGDARLAAWLTEQGFEKVNHCWWRLATTP